MQWLAQICVRRPVFAAVIILTLVVVGLFCYTRLGVDRYPKIDTPTVTVTVRQEGASPREIETEIIDKIEASVNTISGVDQLSSTAYDGVGQVVVNFVLEKNIDVAAQEVRDKVNAIQNDLPRGLDAPTVEKLDPDAIPLMEVALSAKAPIRNITEYADKVFRRKIEGLRGVGQVRILGGRKRQINVWADANQLRAYSLTALDVRHALQEQNLQLPGGKLDEGQRKTTLRTEGRVANWSDFRDITVASRENAEIRLSDVARIEDGVEEAKTAANLNGTPTVLLSIRKQSGLNTVETADALRERLKAIEPTLPPGYTMIITRDQSVFTRAAAAAVQEHLVLGSLLASIVVLFFLWNGRMTVIAAIAIPASIISTFALMYAMGFTLNIITLLALTLSVGIVIDDAIVVLENIFRFVQEKRMTPFEAAIEGTREIGLAVLATTLSLIAVFLPIGFMTGLVGRFLSSFGLTMAFAIFISMIVSFTLTPMLSSRWIRVSKTPSTEVGEGAHKPTKGVYYRVENLYMTLLRFALRRRWVVVLTSIAVFIATVPLGLAVNKNFLPEDDESQFEVSVRASEGTSLIASEALGNRIATDIRTLKGVDYTVVSIGNNAQQTENLITIFVKMVDVSRRPQATQQATMEQVRSQILARYRGLRTSVSAVTELSGGGNPGGVSYYLAGPDLDLLTKYSQRALAELNKIPGVADADSSLVIGNPEVKAHIDRRRAADLHTTVNDISDALNVLVGGEKVTDYYESGEQYEVHLRADLPYRTSLESLSSLSVPSSKTPERSTQLSQVVTLERTTGPSQITRLDRQRSVNLTANVLPGASQQEIQQRLAQIVTDLHMPSDYSSGVAGISREQVKAFGAFGATFLLSLVFMYLVLAAQFESWIHPITILLALPLTIPFTLLAILLSGTSLNIYSMLGILVLFGVIKKNGILQVDHTNQLRAQGLSRQEAILQANRDRLRPILMTTVAFVAGMIPLVLSSGTGAATNRTIGYAVIGGQTFSLVLTLIATPVFYSLFDDLVKQGRWTQARERLRRVLPSRQNSRKNKEV